MHLKKIIFLPISPSPLLWEICVILYIISVNGWIFLWKATIPKPSGGEQMPFLKKFPATFCKIVPHFSTKVGNLCRFCNFHKQNRCRACVAKIPLFSQWCGLFTYCIKNIYNRFILSLCIFYCLVSASGKMVYITNHQICSVHHIVIPY